MIQRLRMAMGLLMLCGVAHAELIFYDQDAGIEIKNTSTLEIATASLKPIDGTIVKNPGGAIIGFPIYFNNGIFSDGDFDVLLTATYDPNQSFSLLLSGTKGGGTAFYFVNNPGHIPQRIIFRGVNNRFEGLPSFVNNNTLKLADKTTTVSIALQKELNQNIILSGGTLVFDDDLILNDNVKLQDTGKVFFNGNNLVLGTKQLTWTDTLRLFDAENIVFNGDSNLTSRWSFQGNAHIIGNNNTLSLLRGGLLFVKKNSTLKISNLKIDGLGRGTIEFEDKTARVEFFECRVELETDYTFTTGGIYVSGESTIVTRDHILTFAQRSSVTIDGTSLFYDTLDFKDIDNIRTFTERNTNNYGLLNGGSIRYFSSNKIGDENFNGDTFLDRTVTINKKRNLIVNNNTKIDGRSQTMIFARQANEPIVIVKAGKGLRFENVLLSDFPLVNTEIQAGGQIVFGNDTTLELGESAILDKVLYFEGNVLVNGNNKTIVMTPSAKLVLRSGARVIFDDIKIKGITADSLVLYDNTITVSFGDVEWTQDASYTFSHGHFEVLGNFSLLGTSTFSMATDQACIIQPIGELEINNGATFLYAPTTENRDLLALVDKNAILHLAGGTFASTTTGARLIKGTLLIDSKSYLRNDGAVSVSEGIAIGNGIIIDDLILKIEPAATLELLSGVLAYENVV